MKERYLWKGDTLGGKPGPAAEGGIDWLVREGSLRHIAIMCVEWDPQACHRLRDIGFRLLARGIDAVHLLHDGTERTTRSYIGNI